MAEATSLVERARSDADRLAETAILTERQALAYALREVHGIGREAAADVMGTTPSNVDQLERKAGSHIDDARELVEIVNEQDSVEECPRCGSRLVTEPHFPDLIGQENREFERGCHACGWRERDHR